MFQLRVDDPVDAVAVHCGSGLLSILLAPLFRYVPQQCHRNVLATLKWLKQFLLGAMYI